MTRGKSGGKVTFGREPVHTYPSNYPRGTHWAIDEAWEILDFLTPGALSLEVRSLLAGMIAGKLMRERDRAVRIANMGAARHVAEMIRHG